MPGQVLHTAALVASGLLSRFLLDSQQPCATHGEEECGQQLVALQGKSSDQVGTSSSQDFFRNRT
jgi:hypothetical protein